MFKLKSSTIIEVIVSMVLLLLMSGIFFSFYSNLLIDSQSGLEAKANNILDDISIQTKKERKYLDEEINTDGLLIQKSFILYKDVPGLYLMTLKANGPGHRTIATRKEIFSE